MKHIFYTLLVCVALASCKTEPKQMKAEYPAFWQENNIPRFVEGTIAKHQEKQEDLKVTHNLILDTPKSFDEIHQWHLNEFKANGWRNVKNLRKNIGGDDELMIIVHTLGKTKHSATVLKKEENLREIKSIVSKFGG